MLSLKYLQHNWIDAIGLTEYTRSSESEPFILNYNFFFNSNSGTVKFLYKLSLFLSALYFLAKIFFLEFEDAFSTFSTNAFFFKKFSKNKFQKI